MRVAVGVLSLCPPCPSLLPLVVIPPLRYLAQCRPTRKGPCADVDTIRFHLGFKGRFLALLRPLSLPEFDSVPGVLTSLPPLDAVGLFDPTMLSLRQSTS